MRPTHIGGQAVIEGVMMRGKNIYTLAVRKPDSTIYTEDVGLKSQSKKNSFLKLPLVRGVVSFVESLVVGMEIISKSAEVAMEGLEDDQEAGKIDKFLEEKFGDKLNDVLMGFSVVISIVLGISLFMLLPVAISGLIKKFFPIDSWLLLSLLEGVIRILIFVGYLFLVSRSKDIKRVFMYHGAEHKTISCFESGEALIVENVKKHTRYHKRCGTSFLLIVMVISILTFMFIRTDSTLIRVISRIVLVPFIAGVSYEIIRWAGRSDSLLVNLVSKPGMMLQGLTTVEPTDDQIEVAIAAMKGVLNNESPGEQY